MLGSVSSLNTSAAAVSASRFKLASGQLMVPAAATASMLMNPVAFAPSSNGAYYHASLMPAQASAQTNATQAHVSFGSCICPICASLAIIVETHNKIKKLQSGDGIVPGEMMQQIQAKTGFNYVPHERATRLERPAASDIEKIEKAAMDRISGMNGHEKLEIPSEKSLYSVVSASLMMADNKIKDYKAHRNDILYSPSSNHAVEQTISSLKNGHYQVMSILHHMQNADDRVTKPMSMGYMLTGQINQAERELAVMSLRPLPRMENSNAESAGLANLLTGLATDPKSRFDSVAVAVEASQADLKRYLENLKTMGVEVKRYARLSDDQKPNGLAITEMPKPYEIELAKLYPKTQPALYQIDLQGVRAWSKTGMPSESKKAILALNPDLEQSLKVLAKEQKSTQTAGLSAEALLTILSPPPPPGSRRPLPREEELGHHSH